MRDGFIKVAAGTPRIRVADCHYNAEQIFTMMREADQQGCGCYACRSFASPAIPAAICFYRIPCSGGGGGPEHHSGGHPEPGSGDRRGAAGAGQVGRQAVQLSLP